MRLRPRKRTIAAIVVAAKCVLLSLAALFLIAFRPKQTAEYVMRRLFPGREFSVKSVRWLSPRSVEVKDLQVFGVASADRLLLKIRPARLLTKQVLYIEQLDLVGPRVSIYWDKTLAQQRSAVTAPNNSSAQHTAAPWPVHVEKLRIKDGSISLVGIGPGIPDIVIPINTEFQQLATLETQLQKVVIEDIALCSPYDILAKVFEVDQIELEFTIQGLLEHRIEKLGLMAPVIYLGPDLFWFSDRAKTELAKWPKSGASPDWVIGRFHVIGGQVVVASRGQPDFQIPVVFQVDEKELRLTSIQDLHLKSTVSFPPRDLDYPAMDLAIDNIRGRLFFALPRTEPDSNNVVNQLTLDQIRWRKLHAENLWLAATCDALGIYLEFGGDAYGGYVNGNASFFFNDLQWRGSISSSRIRLLPVTQALFPDHVRMDATASGTIVASGTANDVKRVDGAMSVAKGGKMEVLTIDELAQKIPADLQNAKGDAIRIALEAFRNYHFRSGDIRFAYSPPSSTFKLKTDGPEGKRDIDIVYQHATPREENRP